MTKRIVRKLVVGMMCISSVVAQAQSYYNEEWCDVDYNDCQFVDVQIIGDPGVSGCGRQATLSSTLNGQYSSSSAAYPNTATVNQQIANASPGVDYSWAFTYTFFYDNPYGRGGCVSSAVSWLETLGVAINTFQFASAEANGYYEYELACPNGNSKATCPADLYQGSESFKWAEEFLLRGTDKNGVRWCAAAGPVTYLNTWPAPFPCR
jgi:hypothetical protein